MPGRLAAITAIAALTCSGVSAAEQPAPPAIRAFDIPTIEALGRRIAEQSTASARS